MADHDNHKQYAKCMKRRSEGHALYRNVSALKLKPGTCGYFDNDGDWQVIIQASEVEALQKHNLPALDDVRYWTDDGEDYWRGPVTSKGVTGSRVDMNIHAADGTTTVVAGGKLEFTSSETRSAILVAKGNVEHHQSTPETKIRAWGSTNAQALIDLSGDRDIIKKKGFWIVTKTYTAQKCSISLLLDKESKSSYSVTAGSHGVKVSPTMEWWESQKDEDWRALSHSDGVVMFMCGVWWRPRLLSKEMKIESDKKKQKHLASHAGAIPVDVTLHPKSSTDPEYYHFTPAVVGQDSQGSLHLPQAGGSPYDDQNIEGRADESDEDEDETSEDEDADGDSE